MTGNAHGPRMICGWAENIRRTAEGAKDSSFGFEFEAVYNMVEPFKEISYTMGDGRMATTIFESNGDTTNVTTTFDAEDQNPPEFLQQGIILKNMWRIID